MSYPFFTSIGISFYSFLINIYMSIVETERLSKIEGRVEELSKRVDDLKSDISSLRNEVIATRNEMNHRIDSLRSEIMSEISNLRNGLDKIGQSIFVDDRSSNNYFGYSNFSGDIYIKI